MKDCFVLMNFMRFFDMEPLAVNFLGKQGLYNFETFEKVCLKMTKNVACQTVFAWFFLYHP